MRAILPGSRPFDAVARALLPDEALQREAAVAKALDADGSLRPWSHRSLHDPVIFTSYVAGTLSVVNQVGAQHRCPRAGRIVRIDAAVKTAPTGQALELRIRRLGVTLASLSIPAGETMASWVDGFDVEPGDWLALDITQVGSGTAGAHLTVQLEEMVRTR